MMLAYLFVVIAVAARFLPHAFWNFTPVGASLLYFGARQPRRRMWFPVVLLALSDVILTRWYWHAQITADHLITVAWYAGAVLIGSLLRDRTTVTRIVAASLATSISFFALSNLAVWVFGSMYAHTVAGLVQCYVAAVPFFRHTLESDLIYSGLFFGTPVVIAALQRAMRTQRAAV